MIKEITYKCEFCGYWSHDLELVERHEDSCIHNPKNHDGKTFIKNCKYCGKPVYREDYYVQEKRINGDVWHKYCFSK